MRRPVASQTAGVLKVVYSAPGIYKVQLPAGFDPGRVRITRGGRVVPALAATADGLILFGPGYADDYTDKDAFFVTATGAAGASPAGVPRAGAPVAPLTGLFSLPATTVAPDSVTAEFHDVYFDWSLRPYDMAPWFSSQYLTESSTQTFSIDTPNIAGGTTQVVVTLWSVTDGAHALALAVNGQAIGQKTWTGG